MGIQERRYRDMQAGFGLKPDGESLDALKRHLDDLHWAIAAAQSLDDLGSPEANKDAWDQMLALQDRYQAVSDKIKALESQS